MSALTSNTHMTTDFAIYLARMAVLLLGDGRPSFDAWRGTDAMRAVLMRATDPERSARYSTVRVFVDAWREAAGVHREPHAEGE